MVGQSVPLSLLSLLSPSITFFSLCARISLHALRAIRTKDPMIFPARICHHAGHQCNEQHQQAFDDTPPVRHCVFSVLTFLRMVHIRGAFPAFPRVLLTYLGRGPLEWFLPYIILPPHLGLPVSFPFEKTRRTGFFSRELMSRKMETMLSSGFPLLGLEGKRENQLPSLLSLSALCPSLRMEGRRGQGKAGFYFPSCWYHKKFLLAR